MATYPESNSGLVIGEGITWESIEKEACRVKHFTPLAKMEGNKVIAVSKSMPYALLKVESPKLPQEATMPVVHRLDFKNLWEIFKQRGLGEEEELLVFYVPFFEKGLKKLFSKGMPKLHFYIYPKGRLEQIYDPTFEKSLDGEAWRQWIKPIAKWVPKGYGM
jgi:hypothetical protein